MKSLRAPRFAGRLYLLAVLALLLAAPVQAAPERSTLSIRLSETPGAYRSVNTDGKTVVWTHAPRGPRSAVYAARLSEGRPFLVAETGMNADADVDGDLVVWTAPSADAGACGSDLRAKNLATGQELAAGSTPGDDVQPAISGQLLAWLSHNCGEAFDARTVMLRDLGSSQTRVLSSLPTGWSAGQPEIHGQRVIWAEWERDPTDRSRTLRSRLLLYEAGAAEPRLLESREGQAIKGYAIHGNRIIYIADHQVMLLDIANPEHREVFSGSYGSPTTDGRYIVVTDMSRSDRYTLQGYDMQSGASFAVPAAFELNSQPQLAGDVLIWAAANRDAVPNGWQVFAASLKEVLPSGWRPEPSSRSPELDYFAITGHTLGGGFKRFWDRSGGLAVFGYPLTEEYQELNRDSFQYHTTQYFERQRFEHHPQHAGTPYEVLLGRLGAEMLQRQGRDWGTEPKASPSTPHYFPETGHAIAPQFWDYWRSQGLEFGDPGVSFAEALALFGYPITEPKLETNSSGDTVLTQWFERARFEWHPNNPAQHRVLLGRLAADYLQQRGW